jgi:hypothetical protein
MKDSEQLHQGEFEEYANGTTSGMREFQPSSALRTLMAAASQVKGGNGGRILAAICTSLCKEF